MKISSAAFLGSAFLSIPGSQARLNQNVATHALTPVRGISSHAEGPFANHRELAYGVPEIRLPEGATEQTPTFEYTGTLELGEPVDIGPLKPYYEGLFFDSDSDGLPDLYKEYDEATQTVTLNPDYIGYYKIGDGNIADGTTITCQIQGCENDSNETFINIAMYEVNGAFNEEAENIAVATAHVCPAAVSITFTGDYPAELLLFSLSLEKSIEKGTVICYETCDESTLERRNLVSNNPVPKQFNSFLDGKLGLGDSVEFDLKAEADTDSDGTIDDDSELFYQIGNVRAGKTITCQIEGCVKDTDNNSTISLVMWELEIDDSNEITDVGIFSSAGSHVCPGATSLQFSGDFKGYVVVKSEDEDLSGGELYCYETEDNALDTGGICFSGESMVEVQGKGSTLMKDLQVNDKVFVGADSNGIPKYQNVYAFGHLDKETPHEYLQLYTGSAKPLEISAAHLLYVEGKAHPVRADSIQKGDSLIQSTVDGAKKMVQVTKINKVTRNGAYMPLTKDGPIVVDEILASSYVSIMHNAPEIVSQYLNVLSEDQLLHGWLAPYRMVCERAPTLCENDYNEEGIAYWLVFGRFVAEVGNGMGSIAQSLGLVAFGIFMAAAVVLEGTVAFFGSPIGFGVGAALVGFCKGSFGWNGVEVTKKVD